MIKINRKKQQPKPVGQHGIVTIYVKPPDRHLWTEAAGRAERLHMTRSQYILWLIEKDLVSK